jgi:hypothetical protein
MPFKFSNVATAPIATSISNSVTSIAVTAGLGALFPSLSAGEVFSAVLFDSSNNVEFVRVTARSGDVLTVVRGQEGSLARAFAAASRLELRVTAAALANIVQLDGAQTVTGQKTFTQTIIGNLQGNAATATTAAACSGNSATVTNGVYTNTSQTVSGDKTFTGTTYLNGVQRATNLFIGQADTFLYENVPNALAIRTGPSGSHRFTTIDAAGNFTAPGDITAFSDERLKQNWRDLPADFLERLAEVKMGIYDRRDTGETQAGVSAQSMKALLSPVVREGTDGMLSVAYGNAALASCVVLARELVALKARLAVLEV